MNQSQYLCRSWQAFIQQIINYATMLILLRAGGEEAPEERLEQYFRDLRLKSEALEIRPDLNEGLALKLGKKSDNFKILIKLKKYKDDEEFNNIDLA